MVCDILIKIKAILPAIYKGFACLVFATAAVIAFLVTVFAFYGCSIINPLPAFEYQYETTNNKIYENYP